MNLENDNESITKYSKFSYPGINNFPITRESKIFIFHKIINGLNFSVLVLLFILSFLSLNGQRKWTDYYSIMTELRSINNNLVDYISTTEESYISEIYKIDNFKKTTSKDLLYISNNIKPKKINKILQNFLNLKRGIRDGRFQRGNL